MLRKARLRLTKGVMDTKALEMMAAREYCDVLNGCKAPDNVFSYGVVYYSGLVRCDWCSNHEFPIGDGKEHFGSLLHYANKFGVSKQGVLEAIEFLKLTDKRSSTQGVKTRG